MLDNEKLLAFIKANGPVLPMQLAKEFKHDSIIIGAVLSSLAGQKKLIISTAKIGGSPVYYLKGQEEKLESLYKYLNEKDQRAYDLLKEKHILRDSELTPLLRVSLRAIKDFAKSVPVQVGDKEEIFWRWYLLPPNKAAEEIQAYFGGPKQDAKLEPAEEKPAKPAQKLQAQKEKEAVKSADSGEAVSVQEEKKTKTKERQGKEEPVKAEEKEDEEGEDDFIFGARQTTLDGMQAVVGKQADKEREKPAEKKQQAQKQQEQPSKEGESVAVFGDSLKDKLHIKAKEFFMKKGIIIRTVNVIKANSEIDYVVFVPTPVGNITYFGKAKSKKKISESDLAAAFIKGQNKKLPVLFITSGELTKKAGEMLRTDFENIKYVKLE